MDKEQDFFSKLAEKAKSAKLTEREKTVLFSAVDSFVKAHPLSSNNTNTGNILSPFTMRDFGHFIPSFNFLHIHGVRSMVAAIVLVVVVIGSGTSFAAQGSLPGDILYPIRVNINEELKAIFLPDAKRPAYEVERVKSRVEEVKKLVEQDRFSEEIKEKVASKINSHVSTVREEVDDLAQKGELKAAFEISSNLETSLAQSEIAIAEELTKKDIPDDERASVKKIISIPREASTVARETTEDQILTLEVEDDSTKAIAEAKYDAVQKIRESLAKKMEQKNSVTTETPEDVSLFEFAGAVSLVVEKKKGVDLETIQTLSEQVNNLMKNGEAKLESKEYALAFNFFKEAYDLAEAAEIQFDLETEDIGVELEEIISGL